MANARRDHKLIQINETSFLMTGYYSLNCKPPGGNTLLGVFPLWWIPWFCVLRIYLHPLAVSCQLSTHISLICQCSFYTRKNWSNWRFEPMSFRLSLIVMYRCKLVIPGGLIGSSTVSSSEMYSEGYASFVAGTSLPIALQRHCAVKINGSHAIVAGGRSSTFSEERRVYLLNLLEEQWIGLPSMVEQVLLSVQISRKQCVIYLNAEF